MSLHPIVAALGGDLYQGGRRANVPAPGHSQADRSVSLLLEGDRLVIHGFGAADWRSVRDHLRALGLIDVEGRVTGARPSLAASSTALPDPGVRIEVARRLWASTIPIVEGDLCARHLRRRGIETPPARLGDLRRHRPGARPGLRSPRRRRLHRHRLYGPPRHGTRRQGTGGEPADGPRLGRGSPGRRSRTGGRLIPHHSFQGD
jgi:hypothetical protein